MFKPRQASKRCGFTLIEIAIVILVMSILAAVGVPTYRKVLTNYRVDLAARKLSADLQYARSEAQRKSASQTVTFSLDENLYTLVGQSDLNHSDQAYVVHLIDEPFYAQLINASFGGASFVVFDMHGHPSSPGSILLRTGGAQKTVSLAADGTVSLP
jgi:prepilin-type N-terminal cleavage/methylation domain-containing protein